MTTDTPIKPKSPGKKAELMTPEQQRKAFEDTARELECDESEERFEAALRAIAKQKPK